MNWRYCFIIYLLTLVSTSAVASTLTTSSYNVTVSQNCTEGNVTCDDVSYKGVSRKTGKSIELNGTTMHSMCADGVTPCRFLGYEFVNGDITYKVLESGILQVIRGDSEVLLEEKGTWGNNTY